MEETGPEGVGPIPALAAINVQQPTAELRPAELARVVQVLRPGVAHRLPPRRVLRPVAARHLDAHRDSL